MPADQSPNFLTFKETKNRLQGINYASLSSLTGRDYNPIPTRFLAPIDCLKIPAQSRKDGTTTEPEILPTLVH
jgi:hypothetical protein